MSKVAPDFLIQRTIKQNDKHAEQVSYIKDQSICTNQAKWFMSKLTKDHANKEKADKAFVDEELRQANNELTLRRKQRISALYEYEARLWEDELGELGLRVQRQR